PHPSPPHLQPPTHASPPSSLLDSPSCAVRSPSPHAAPLPTHGRNSLQTLTLTSSLSTNTRCTLLRAPLPTRRFLRVSPDLHLEIRRRSSVRSSPSVAHVALSPTFAPPPVSSARFVFSSVVQFQSLLPSSSLFFFGLIDFF
ncbi:Os04g0217600, partial [Oryza sativa Japonica Group]